MAHKAKQHVVFEAKNPFAFAGLWETWKKPLGPLEAFTLLTTEPNALCAPIHNRMPVVLARDDWAKWLGSIDERKKLAAYQFPAQKMECWPVGRAVGNVRNDDPSLIEPVV